MSVKLVTKKKAHEKHRLYLLSRLARDQKGDPRGFHKVGAKSEDINERVEVAKEVSSRIFSVKANGTEGIYSMKKWESEKRTSIGVCPAEGFKGHVATDGSSAGKSGKVEEHVVGQWCSWITMRDIGAIVQGMYGSMEAELEVQRTIKRAELTAFLCPLKRGDWTCQGAC